MRVVFIVLLLTCSLFASDGLSKPSDVYVVEKYNPFQLNSFPQLNTKGVLSKEYFNTLKNFYISRKTVAESFFNKKNKKIVFYLINNEMNETQEATVKNRPKYNLGDSILKNLRAKIKPLKELNVSTFVNKSVSYEDADIIIVLKVDLSTSKKNYLQYQNNINMVELNLNYQIYIPAVYNKEPVSDVYIKETLANRQYNNKSLVDLMLLKLQDYYAWGKFPEIIHYLSGEKSYKKLFDNKYAINNDDVFAIKLLALADWNNLQSNLLREGHVDGLMDANILYPFSKLLSSAVFARTKEMYDVKEKAKYLNYLYVANYLDLLDLLNDVLSQISNVSQVTYIGPILLVASSYGNSETVGYLTRIRELILDDPTPANRPFLQLLNTVINKIDNKK